MRILQFIDLRLEIIILHNGGDNNCYVNHIPPIDMAFVNGFRQSVRSTEKM